MDATMENKMGLPPPYEPSAPTPEPPPSYFGSNPPPPVGSTPAVAPPRTVVTTAPSITVQMQASRAGNRVKLGPLATGVICPSCGKQVITRVNYSSDPLTHAAAGMLCLVASCCCGCLFPYCIKSCKTAHHYCPECTAFIGEYKSFNRSS